MVGSESHQQTNSGQRLAVTALQVLLAAFTPLALISIGGFGIYAAPVLLPLLWIAANASLGSGRWYFIVLAALVAAETAWAISWSLVPSLQLALPILAAMATVFLFVKTWHRDLPIQTAALVLVALGAFGLAGIGSLAVGGDNHTRGTFERINR
jgi:hypothetical protein